ncbi:MAG: hypothetical protein DRP29_01435 [Thermodesulfobacteriota bacterium]|nr:MAG: hypothetical protein DRP29_01435 [Thermodesulfobacteriota bacterium]RLG13095.1 MAG: hypothetical protein DRN73_00340 [Candidatus Pacearchaeota archaeon]
MKKKNPPIRTHKIKVKKPLPIKYKEKIVCPYCKNSEEFYEIIENATFIITYFQTEDGTLETIEKEVEIKGPAKFYCGKCHADLTYLKQDF